MKNFKQYYEEGLEHCRTGAFENGISAFTKAIDLNPTHIESLYNRGKAKFKLKLYDECIADLNLANAIAPNNPLLYSERAIVYYHMGKIDKSLKDLDTAVALEPENPYRYASRAYIKDKANDLHGAILDYNMAISLDPNDAISYNNKGLVEEKLGYSNRSKQSFKKADGLSPSIGKQEPKPEKYTPSEFTQEVAKKSSKKRFSAKEYFVQIRKSFTSKEGLKDFFSFLIDLFKKPVR